MILVKDLIKKLKEQDQESYVSIGDSVLHSGLGSEYTSFLINGDVRNRGAVSKDDFIDFEEGYMPDYDENKPWVEIE